MALCQSYDLTATSFENGLVVTSSAFTPRDCNDANVASRSASVDFQDDEPLAVCFRCDLHVRQFG